MIALEGVRKTERKLAVPAGLLSLPLDIRPLRWPGLPLYGPMLDPSGLLSSGEGECNFVFLNSS